MKFLYNLFASVKRNWFFYIIMVVVLVLSMYMGISAVNTYGDFDTFFAGQSLNEEYAECDLVSRSGFSEMTSDEWDIFVSQGLLQKQAYASDKSFYKNSSMDNRYDMSYITPSVTKIMNTTYEGQPFGTNADIVGDGKDAPLEAIVSIDMVQEYKIGKVYQIKEYVSGDRWDNDVITKNISVKIIGHYDSNYSAPTMWSGGNYKSLYSRGNPDMVVCGYPTTDINSVVISENIGAISETEEISVEKLGAIYEEDYESTISAINLNIYMLLTTIFIIVAGIIANMCYRADFVSRRNAIKHISGEKKSNAMVSDTIIGAMVAGLAFIIIVLVGVIDPEIFNSKVLNGAFWGIASGICGFYLIIQTIASVFQNKNVLKTIKNKN